MVTRKSREKSTLQRKEVRNEEPKATESGPQDKAARRDAEQIQRVRIQGPDAVQRCAQDENEKQSTGSPEIRCHRPVKAVVFDCHEKRCLPSMN